MQLDRYISDLLLEHNCVILPSFGGFVGNYIPAKVDTVKNKFTPPTKEIGFNQNLKKNDGLLVNYVAEQLSLSYQEAESKVDKAILELNTSLNQSKTLTLKRIGHFYFDQEQKLKFEPSFEFNHSLSSFGLSVFHVNPIIREVKVEEDVREKSNEAKVIPIQIESNSDSRPWKRIAVAAAILPLIFYFGWLSFATELFRGKNFSYADMNPFSKKICPTYKLRTELESRQVEGLKALFDLNTENNLVRLSLFDRREAEFDPNKLIVVSLSDKNLAIRETTSVADFNVKEQQYKFHIIAGCFGVYKNADRLAAKLRKKGFSAGIIDRNNGLYRVAFQSFTNQKDAENALAEIKANHMKEAWLLEK